VRTRNLRLAGGIAALALIASACGNGLEDDGNGDTNGDNGEAAGEVTEPGDASLEGAEITVGSKDFDEQLILGEISVALLEDAGVNVTNEVNLGGTDAARAALESGEIDHYWEYTGTAWISFFGETEPIPDRVEQYEAVRDRDAEERGLFWLEPTPFNNTYGLAISQEADAELGVDAISELGPLLESDPDLVTLCVESEFNVRDDGLPGMEEHYGFEIPGGNVTVLDTGVIYGATADRDPCNLGEVFTTDGRIAALDLKVLEDDESFFPLYNVSPVFVEDVWAEYGSTLQELYAPVAEALDDDTMASLNARVSADGERPEDVARDWLSENGFIG
jgi:osmoprotectant transport system substrate-binding protein